MSKISRTDAFKYFGTPLRNTYWSRSARSVDGKTVVVALWRDQLKKVGNVLTYVHSTDVDWFRSQGQNELCENLIWCRDKCGGIFKVVIVTAKNAGAIPREVASSDPEKRYDMLITSLDQLTGAFTSECIWHSHLP